MWQRLIRDLTSTRRFVRAIRGRAERVSPGLASLRRGRGGCAGSPLQTHFFRGPADLGHGMSRRDADCHAEMSGGFPITEHQADAARVSRARMRRRKA
jgi:hypothetical protein